MLMFELIHLELIMLIGSIRAQGEDYVDLVGGCWAIDLNQG